MQAYGGIENIERAVGVDPDNPVIPVILVVGGAFYFGYVHLITGLLCMDVHLGALLVYVLIQDLRYADAHCR